MTERPGPQEDNSPAVQALLLRALSLEEAARIPFLRSQTGLPTQLIDEAEKLVAIVASGSTSGDPLAAGHAPPLGSRAGGLDVPAHIDGYQIIRPIGEGGMGRAFLAKDVAREQDVALKILRPSLFSPGSHGRFEKEVRIHGKLDHPGIVKFLSSGVMQHPIGNLCYLATEFVDGPNIREYVKSRASSDREILNLIAEVCDAAHHAHAQGVIHRDLKPSNILVDRFGKPKILDFGLACTLDPAYQNASQVTASGVLIGTLRYMSPEQARADSTLIGPRSDLYSIGVIAFELLADRLPYSIRGEETFPRIIAAILTAEPELLSVACPRFQERALDPVLARAMAREPENRYPTCSAFARDLRLVAHGKTPMARSVTASAPNRALASADTVRVGTSPRRRRIPSVALAALLLGAAVIGGQLLRRETGESTDEVLASVYGSLTEAEQNIHRDTPTDSTLRHTIGVLNRTRQALVMLPQDERVGHLMRFTNWRLGECHFFLGSGADDIGQLKLAYASWGEASSLPFDREIGAKLPRSLPFHSAIVGDGMHIPFSGAGGIRERLALFESPVVHLRAALINRRFALSYVNLPVRSNYTAEVESLNVTHNRGLVLNEFGSTLCKLGWAVDSLHLVQEGMEKYAAAEKVPDFATYREPYASFLSNYGLGYAIRAELSSNVADIDSALIRYQESIWFQDASRGVGTVPTRHRIVAAHLQAAALDEGLSREDHLLKAEELLTSLRKDVNSARTLVRIEQGLLETRLFRERAQDVVPMKPSPQRTSALGQLLDAADAVLSRADEARKELAYPTPAANVLREKARLAVLRAQLVPSPENEIIGRQAIEEARLAIGVVDFPAHHRDLRELAARLP